MIVLYALLVPLALAEGSDPRKDQKLVTLVKDLEERYYITCTTLLYSERQEEVHYRAFNIGKMMMTSYGSHGCVTVKPIRTYVRLYDLQEKGCSRFFLVILADEEEDIREDLVELSQKITTAGTVWLVYVNQNESLPEFFRDVNAAYDMDMLAAEPLPDGNVKLSDVYRVTMEHPVRIRDYGVWSEAYGLKSFVALSFYSRRQDLEGIVLKVVFKQSPLNHVVPKKNGKGYILKGVFGTVWKDMERKLNFSIVYQVANRSGAPMANNEWSGLIGMMLRDKMDVGVGEVTMSPERCSVIHCLRPIIATRNQLYFKKTRLRLRWDAVLKPFHSETWVTILLWFLTSSACLNIFFRVSRRYDLEHDSVDFNFLNSLSTVYSAFCQQGSFMTPDSLSCRIIFFMSYIVATILFTVYSASLTSFITAAEPFRPFENLEDLLRDGTYTLQPISGSAAYSSFMSSTDPLNRKVFRKLIAIIPASALPQDTIEGLERVCQNDKIVFLGSEFQTKRPVAEINRKGQCEIITLEKPLNMVYITMLLSKSSRFKEVFNHHLDAISHNGLLQRRIKKAWEEMELTQEKTFAGVGISQVFQMYLILSFGLCSSAVLFAAELTHSAASQRCKRKTKTV